MMSRAPLEDQQVIEQLGKLRSLTAPTPFRYELRRTLMNQPEVAKKRRWTWQLAALRPLLALGVVAGLLVGGTSWVAADSLPGDAGYPVKQTAEDVHLTISADEQKPLVLTEQLAHRGAELTHSLRQGKAVQPALHSYQQTLARLEQSLHQLRPEHRGDVKSRILPPLKEQQRQLVSLKVSEGASGLLKEQLASVILQVENFPAR